MRRLAVLSGQNTYVFASLVSGRAVLAEGWPTWVFWPLSTALCALGLVAAQVTIRHLNRRADA